MNMTGILSGLPVVNDIPQRHLNGGAISTSEESTAPLFFQAILEDEQTWKQRGPEENTENHKKPAIEKEQVGAKELYPFIEKTMKEINGNEFEGHHDRDLLEVDLIRIRGDRPFTETDLQQNIRKLQTEIIEIDQIGEQLLFEWKDTESKSEAVAQLAHLLDRRQNAEKTIALDALLIAIRKSRGTSEESDHTIMSFSSEATDIVHSVIQEKFMEIPFTNEDTEKTEWNKLLTLLASDDEINLNAPAVELITYSLPEIMAARQAVSPKEVGGEIREADQSNFNMNEAVVHTPNFIHVSPDNEWTEIPKQMLGLYQSAEQILMDITSSEQIPKAAQQLYPLLKEWVALEKQLDPEKALLANKPLQSLNLLTQQSEAADQHSQQSEQVMENRQPLDYSKEALFENSPSQLLNQLPQEPERVVEGSQRVDSTKNVISLNSQPPLLSSLAQQAEPVEEVSQPLHTVKETVAPVRSKEQQDRLAEVMELSDRRSQPIGSRKEVLPQSSEVTRQPELKLADTPFRASEPALFADEAELKFESVWKQLISTYKNREQLPLPAPYQVEAKVTVKDLTRWIENLWQPPVERPGQQQAITSAMPLSKLEQFVIYVQQGSERSEQSFYQQFESIIQSSKFIARPNGPAELSITLNPGNLGEMLVRLTETNGEMMVKILVTSTKAKEMLESNMNQLRHMFAPNQVVIEKQDGPIHSVQAADEAERHNEERNEEEQSDEHRHEQGDQQPEQSFNEYFKDYLVNEEV